MEVTTIYECTAHVCMKLKHGSIYLGIDIGIRNFAWACLGMDSDRRKIYYISAGIIDLKTQFDDPETLHHRLTDALDYIFDTFSTIQFRRVRLINELQVRQTEIAAMARVSGMVRFYFYESLKNTRADLEYRDSSPSACTSLAVQKFTGFPPERRRTPKSKKEDKDESDKKDLMVEIYEHWLLQVCPMGFHRMQSQLCKFHQGGERKGKPMKSHDRRNHPADAWGHSMHSIISDGNSESYEFVICE